MADQGKESFGICSELMRQLGTHFNLIALEAPWQNGMVERHGGVLGDIITVTVMETGAVGFDMMKDVCIHSAMAKNRRPGKTGYSPRTMVFGVDERLVASGLNHYLEEPDDAAISASGADPFYKRSMEIRKTAMKAVIELDHSEKWSQAIKFPSRTEFPNFVSPWKSSVLLLRGI